jgi:hypothetical protein
MGACSVLLKVGFVTVRCTLRTSLGGGIGRVTLKVYFVLPDQVPLVQIVNSGKHKH